MTELQGGPSALTFPRKAHDNQLLAVRVFTRRENTQTRRGWRPQREHQTLYKREESGRLDAFATGARFENIRYMGCQGGPEAASAMAGPRESRTRVQRWYKVASTSPVAVADAQIERPTGTNIAPFPSIGAEKNVLPVSQ